MAAQFNHRSISCISCARRKVRCNRLDPCSNCKRRKDACVYPSTQHSTHRKSPTAYTFDRPSTERIQTLERYIRSLGLDPDDVNESPISDRPHPDAESLSIHESHSRKVNANHSGSASVGTSNPGLVDHNEESRYTQTPMWYSWKESGQSADSSPRSKQHTNLSPKAHGFCAALFDTAQDTLDGQMRYKYPSAFQIVRLWDSFQKNVHPLVNVFYRWEKQPVIDKACQRPDTLKPAEEALLFAIYFIAILSLSDDECISLMNETRPKVLHQYQIYAEASLMACNFVATSDLFILQALVLYLLAMLRRARPQTLFSLMGIATRVAERMGLHRDGGMFNLPAVEVENRRRLWWQMQAVELAITQVLGCSTMTLYGDWDTKLPSNLEDEDVKATIHSLPPERQELTNMSHCLWRYHALNLSRMQKNPDGTRPGLQWIGAISASARREKFHQIETFMGDKFLRHCEPVNPLHVYIQIGIRSFLLAAQRTLIQPDIANVQIARMSANDRADFLSICSKCIEYYILIETTESIRKFSWHHEHYFQLPALVFIIIEATDRYRQSVVTELWTLIDKACTLHPRLTATSTTRDFAAIGRLILLAWQKREDFLISQQFPQGEQNRTFERPSCIQKLYENLPPPQQDVEDGGQSRYPDCEEPGFPNLGVPLDRLHTDWDIFNENDLMMLDLNTIDRLFGDAWQSEAFQYQQEEL